MPDRRRHRGPHPRDAQLFARGELGKLCEARADLAYLLGRGYASDAALRLVGDHYQLVARQRLAVSKLACSAAACESRQQRRLGADALGRRELRVDGFNCCITVEVALSGGVVLAGADGAYRDLASVHGSYRRVLETPRALDLLVSALAGTGAAGVKWYLDRPVSNSGMLAGLLRERFERARLPWSVELVDNVDREVVAPGAVAVSADSWVLDRAERWFDVAAYVIRHDVPNAWIVSCAAAAALAPAGALTPSDRSGRE